MMRVLNKKAITICAAVCMLLAYIGFSGYVRTDADNNLLADNLPVVYKHASYAFDIYDPAVFVGAVDYVFVGKVEKKVETIYKDVTTMDTENGPVQVGVPYTMYMVSVLKNIKGSLKKNEPISIRKDGGITLDKKNVELLEDDILPKEEGIYVFLAFTQPDGSLLVSGPNSNLPLPISIKNNEPGNEKEKKIIETKEYKAYLKALQEEVKLQRKRFSCVYDEGGKS